MKDVIRVAPSMASGYVRTMLDKAIDGVGPLRPAASTADAKLVDAAGDVEDAVKSLIRLHVGLAAAEGFITNLGGIAALAVAIPANVVGVTLVQCRLIKGIAHLRGYDLEDDGLATRSSPASSARTRCATSCAPRASRPPRWASRRLRCTTPRSTS